MVVLFALVSLIPMIALGVVLSRLVESRASDHTAAAAADAAAELVETAARTVFGPEGPEGGLDSAGLDAADELFGAILAPALSAETLLILDTDGMVVWSNESDEVGNRLIVDERMETALAGEVTQRLSGHVDGPDGESLPRIDYTLPITMTDGGAVAGIARIRSVDPMVLSGLDPDTRRENLVIGAALFGVWLFLVPLAYTIVARIWGQAERDRQLRLIDPLTGLGNRTLLIQRLEEALAGDGRHNTQTGLMLIDLDGFKAVNDTGGHAIGDMVLGKVAERLLETTRRSELAVRLGGDEFAVMIPNVGRADELEVLAMRLGRALDFPLDFDNGAHIRVTASIGIAVYPDDASTTDELLAAADAKMYQEKRRYYNIAADATAATAETRPRV